jgi:predicted TIM-barrel fold metal-dependent hydrolase
MSLFPSEFFRRQCFVAAFPDDAWLPEVVKYVGEDCVVLSSDYPHPGTSYGLLKALDASYPELTDSVRTKLLCSNASRFFGVE